MALTTWIVNFIDLIWIPVAVMVVAPRHRVWAVPFCAALCPVDAVTDRTDVRCGVRQRVYVIVG